MIHVYMDVLMRAEKEGRRKEERSKQDQTNNKAKQHSTPKAVTPKKMSCPRWDSKPRTRMYRQEQWTC